MSLSSIRKVKKIQQSSNLTQTANEKTRKSWLPAGAFSNVVGYKELARLIVTVLQARVLFILLAIVRKQCKRCRDSHNFFFATLELT